MWAFQLLLELIRDREGTHFHLNLNSTQRVTCSESKCAHHCSSHVLLTLQCQYQWTFKVAICDERKQNQSTMTKTTMHHSVVAMATHFTSNFFCWNPRATAKTRRIRKHFRISRRRLIYRCELSYLTINIAKGLFSVEIQKIKAHSIVQAFQAFQPVKLWKYSRREVDPK